jgi:hypothetical protein
VRKGESACNVCRDTPVRDGRRLGRRGDARIVDEEFADTLSRRPGFVDYEVVASGSDEIVALTVFEDEQSAVESNELAARFWGSAGGVRDPALCGAGGRGRRDRGPRLPGDDACAMDRRRAHASS